MIKFHTDLLYVMGVIVHKIECQESARHAEPAYICSVLYDEERHFFLQHIKVIHPKYYKHS